MIAVASRGRYSQAGVSQTRPGPSGRPTRGQGCDCTPLHHRETTSVWFGVDDFVDSPSVTRLDGCSRPAATGSECERRWMGMRNRENGIPSRLVVVLCHHPPDKVLLAGLFASALAPNHYDVEPPALCGCTIMARFPDPGRAFLPQPISSFPTNPRRTGAPPPRRVNPRRPPSTPHLHVILGPCTRHPPEHSLRGLTALVDTSSRHILHHVSSSSSSSSSRQEALVCCRRCFLQTSLPPGPRRCCCLNQSAPVDKTSQPRARSKDGS